MKKPARQSSGLHEDLRREEKVEGSSDRSFGLVFAGVFTIVGVVKLWLGSMWSLPWFAAAALVLAIAFARPALLAPFNRLWTRFGLLLFRIINPVIMLLIFVVCFVPMGVVMRLFGWDPMRRRLDPDASTYWIPRDPPGPAGESMKNQF